MENLQSNEVLKLMIRELTQRAEELQNFDVGSVGRERRSFIHGEKTAYVECLEMIQTWALASTYGLDYEIERRYKI